MSEHEEWLRELVLSVSPAKRASVARALVSFETGLMICCCSVKEDPVVWNLDRLFWAVRSVQVAMMVEEMTDD